MTDPVTLPGDHDTLPIVQCGDPVLRRAADPVEPSAAFDELFSRIRNIRLAPGTEPVFVTSTLTWLVSPAAIVVLVRCRLANSNLV